MHRSVRRSVALASAALSACAVAVPLTASPALAGAVTAVEKAFLTIDTDGDHFRGLYVENTPTSTPTKIFESQAQDAYNVATSADGSRLIYVQETFSSTHVPLREQVVVRDVSGQVVRVLDDRVADGNTYFSTPQLSPNGTVAVWEQYDSTANTVTLRKANVGSGAATTLKPGLTPYAFLDSTTVLAQDIDGNPFTLPVTGGTAVAAPSVPVNAFNVTVSPDGSHLAWALDTSGAGAPPFTSSVQVATLTLTNGVATAGAPTTIATGLYNRHPWFSRTGATVYFVKNDGTGGTGDVWSAPSDASAPAAVTAATPANEVGIAIGTTDDGVAPGSATVLPATLNGTLATIRWTNPSDADLSGVIVKRSLGSTVQKSVYVPAPVTAYVDSGLALGSTYTYSVTAVDRSGNLATAATRQLFALRAGATFSDPTSTATTRAPFAVRFGSSSATYTVDYLPVGTTTGWKRWVTATAGVSRTFGSAATTGVNATTSVPGTNYVFRVTGVDAYGNSSAAVISGRAVVPFDQTKATLVGGASVLSGSAWLGSIRVLKTTASYAKVTLYGNQLRIIGWRCRACGAFDVYDGSTRVATIDSYGSSTLVRVVLYTRTYSVVGTHTFTIRPRATAGRPNVYLDGFAMRR